MEIAATPVFQMNWEQMNKFRVEHPETEEALFSGTLKECKSFIKENTYYDSYEEKEIQLPDTAVLPDKRFIRNQGGSRSSKTYSLCQAFILFLVENPNELLSVVRKTMSALRTSAMRDFFQVLKDMNLYDVKNHNKSQNIYTFDNGSQVEFFGADDEQKLRGRKRSIVWGNEANELWEEDFIQLNMRTSYFLIFDYNPSENNSWLYTLPIEETKEFKTTFLMNPFLDKAIVKELLSFKEKDEAMWKIYGLGERALTKQNIYSHFKYVETRPEKFQDFIYGLDFGYIHPMALTKVWYHEDDLFIEKIIFESHLTTPELIALIEAAGITYADTIVADSARPDIIAELQKANLTIQLANKSVNAGILAIKTFFVSTNSKEVMKEFEGYKWKKQGERMLEEPIKVDDDLMDSIRYAAMYIKKYLSNQGEVFTIK